MMTDTSEQEDRKLRISADSHMGEPPDLWEKNLPPSMRSRALHFTDILFETNHHLRAGCWDPHERLQDMAIDGLSAEVLYPTNGARIWLLEDRELEQAHIRVYNDWLIDFCRVSPHRLWGLGMLSLWDIDQAISEMQRCMEAGLRGVDIWIAPPEAIPYSARHYERFWDAAQALDVPVSMHINGRTVRHPDDPNGIPAHSINGHKADTMNSLLHIIGSGVLERFPRLQVVAAEVGVGWIPFWLQEFDYYMISRKRDLPKAPSEYFQRQISCAFICDAVGAYLLERYGHDNFMWSNDYPHPASVWPESHIVIPEDLGNLSDEIRQKIVWRNAAKVYNHGDRPLPAEPAGDRTDVENWLASHRDFGATSRLRHAVRSKV